jgi:MIP family channel proteins
MGLFSRNDQRAIVAEFLATLFFVFLGTGAVVAALAVGSDGAATLVCIAIAHGLGILIAVAWTANISGGHINPAVTLSMIVSQRIRPVLGVAYIIAQLAGAVVGSLLLKWAIPAQFANGLGRHSLVGVTRNEAFLLEVVATTFLLVVVYNTAISKKGWGINAPIAIGLSIMLIHFALVPWDGASVNPARSFGPAIVTNDWSSTYAKDFLQVYVLGPAVGGIIAALGWMAFKNLGDDSLEPELAEPEA